jgi:CubicO group peptidase (beta-lactamase class C family)
MDDRDRFAPGDYSISRTRLDAAATLLESVIRLDLVPGAAAAVFHRGAVVRTIALGHRGPQRLDPPVLRDTIFLIASLTKPIVCATAMLLMQDGLVCLDDTVASFVPEFAANGKEAITLRHLLTHTSGLPDQLPQSPALRRQQRPVEEYVAAACQFEPLFPAGTRVSYQSTGILMLAQVIEKVTGRKVRDFLREGLLRPLGMSDSTLGLPDSGMERAALSLPAQFPAGSTDVGDDWNTPYWRDFGAPWGGLHSTVEDLGRFLTHVLGDTPGPLSPAARQAMVRNQLPAGAAKPSPDACDWGLGFMLADSHFGDLVSPDTFGHIGATGTMYWADPRTHLALVILTNQPAVLRNPAREYQHLFPRFSNAVAAALERP